MLLKTILRNILNPIINQFPFCIALYVLWSMELFVRLVGPEYTYSLKVFIFNIVKEPLLNLLGLWAFLYLFAFLIEYINKKWFTVLVYGFVIGLTWLKWFLTINFGIDISPTTIILLVETNRNETIEFLHAFVFNFQNFLLLLCFFLVSWLILVLKKLYNNIKFEEKKNKLKTSFVFGGIVLVMLFCSCYNAYINITNLLKCDDTDELSGFMLDNSIKNPLSEVVYSVYGVYLMNKEENTFEMNVRNFVTGDVDCSLQDSLDIVLVVGESYIKCHSNLYGYYLNTTPLLSKERESGNLFIFNNVITPYSYTSITIKNMLCTNSLSDGERWNDSHFFPQIFKAAGYDVYLWDNQKNLIQNTVWAFALNSFLYNRLICSEAYSGTNEHSYIFDADIVKSFDLRNLSSKHNLVIFHLMGQHFDCNERYPHIPEFEYFTKDSIRRNEEWMSDYKRQRIADYDNATRYNDYVVSQIINLFRNKKSIVIYLSDHGEEVYDYRDSYGRKSDNMSQNQLKYLHEIPFLIWCSDSYRDDNSEIIKLIDQANNRPFMIDNLCQLLFHIGGIVTKDYKNERDLISPQYKPRKRIICDTFNYDSIMNCGLGIYTPTDIKRINKGD